MKSNFDPKKIGKMPPGYIPGISRGDHGFVTRGDLGPMMADITSLARDKAMAQQREREKARDPERENEGSNYNDVNFDTWGGFQNVRLFTSTQYDEEDQEADEIYATIDNYLETRRKGEREKQLKDEKEKLQKKNPHAKEFLKDIMKEIGQMNRQDWLNIPEAREGGSKKSKREEKYTPVPDVLISERLKQNTLGNALDTKANIRTDPISGAQSTNPGNLSALGDARRKILGMSLDYVSQGPGTKSTFDKTGYTTALGAASKLPGDIDIQDLKKARLLFKSMVDSNPSQPKAWQGAARIEELDGKIEEARNIISQGVQHCPDSEDVWFEAIRLEEQSNKKGLTAKALQSCPKSVRLWLLASSLETEKDRKMKILTKGIQYVPHSEKIWRELVDLSASDTEAKELLTLAVEQVPDCLDFRLALARLCPYEEAKEVINKANKYFKNEERAVWIHASKLEEANGNADKCEVLISRGIAKIAKKTKVFAREEWIDEAQECEKANCMATCKAIIKSVFEMDNKEEHPVAMWLEDASLAIQRGNKETARAIYEEAVRLRFQDKGLWESYISFEQRVGDNEKYKDVLNRAASITGTTSQQFLLRLSKELVKAGDTQKAKDLLSNSLQMNPENETLHLSNSELLKQTRDFEAARAAITIAVESLKSPAVYRYYIKFERDLGELNKALEISLTATSLFPYDVDLACDLSTVYEELNKFEKARENYISLTKNPKTQRHSKPWIQYIRLEEKMGGPQRARTIYENSKRYVEKDPEMWYQVVKLEERAGNFRVLKGILSEAVKECPKSGELWAMLVENEPRAGRIRSALNALEVCVNDPYIMNVVARIFWLELKREKTTSWFERSLLVNPGLGDTWAFYYLYYDDAKEEALKQEIMRRCIQAEPSEGRLWRSQADKPSHWDFSTQQLLLLVVEDCRKHMAGLRR